MRSVLPLCGVERRQISERAAFLPLRHRLLIGPVAPGQSPQALLTMLYRATDRLCRCGTAVKNLAHSASLHSLKIMHHQTLGSNIDRRNAFVTAVLSTMATDLNHLVADQRFYFF